jgi:hypothetical protein
MGSLLKTQGTNHSIIRRFEDLAGGIDIEVRQIRPSHLDEWLAYTRRGSERYNRYAGLVKSSSDCGEGSNYCGVAVRAGDNTMEET